MGIRGGLVLSALLLISSSAHAEGGASESAPAVPTSTATINEAANTGQGAQSGAAGMNTAIGGALIAAGMAPCPTPAGCNIPMIIMGMLAMAQAGADSGAADQSGSVADASLARQLASANTLKEKKTGKSVFSGVDPNALAALKNAGYSVSEKGKVTGPNGEIPNEAFNSAGGMSAAGMSGSDALSASALAKKLADEYGAKVPEVQANVVSMGLAGGGGGYSGDSGGSSSGAYDYSSLFKKLTPEQQARMIAGKSTHLGGDPIGVRMDDIFQMVHRRYKTKREVKNYFIEK